MNPDIMLKFEEFMRAITKDDKIALMHHTDADGICAAVITNKAVEKLRGNGAELIFNQGQGEIAVTRETFEKLKTRGISKFIVVDMAVDHTGRNRQFIKDIEKFACVLIVDHHTMAEDLNSGKTVVVKAEKISRIAPDQYCASKMCYDLFGRIVDVRGMDWVAAVGIIGDMGGKTWGKFIDSACRRNNIKKERLEEMENLIAYAWAAGKSPGLSECFNVIYNSKSIGDALDSRLQRYRKDVESEIGCYIENCEKEAEFHNDMIIYEIAPKYNIKSTLINRLSVNYYPDRTVIVIQVMQESKNADISARRQDGKVSMNILLKKALENIPDSSGGGHAPAAGGHMPAECVNEFKKKLLSIL